MGRFDYSFPFAAIIGQEPVKRALLLCAVNPQIGGVIISGEKGTAKSTLARGLGHLMKNAPFVELPLNTTEDRLVGSIDLEATIQTGSPAYAPGLLEKVNGGILYVDEVNLLPQSITNILLTVASSGINHIEREGISLVRPSKFVLIGTMNPEEGQLRPSLLDRFGLYVEVHHEQNLSLRCQIMAQRLSYEQDPLSYCARWQEETKHLADAISNARQLLPHVSVPADCIRYASQLAAQGHCQGHRGELVLCETAIAAAALDGRTEVSIEDIRSAAALALPHRLRESVELSQEISQPQPSAPQESAAESPSSPNPEELPDDIHPLHSNAASEDTVMDEPDVQEIQPMDENLTLHILQKKKLSSLGSGKRLKVRSNSRRGHYVRYRFPDGKSQDIAVDATLRTAVLRGRKQLPSAEGPRIQVKPEDFRLRIREQRTGAVILFVVDASGSMGARKRMGAVKGAVLALLNDAYQKRDTVGIIAFRDKGAQIMLPFTRSVDLAQKRLRTLATGGKTPLAAGLTAAGAMLHANAIRCPDAAQLLVLVSDGRANYGNRADPFQEALDTAKKLSAEPFASVVLDTEQGFTRFGMAKEIADALHAEYCPLSGISQQEIMAQVGRYLS